MMHLEKSWSVASNLTPRRRRGTNLFFLGSLAIGVCCHCSHSAHISRHTEHFSEWMNQTHTLPMTHQLLPWGSLFLSLVYSFFSLFCIDSLQHHPFFPHISTKDSSFLWPLFLTLIILGCTLMISVQNYQNNLTALPVISLPSMRQSH